MYTEPSTKILVKYNYVNCKQDKRKESILSKVCNSARLQVELPNIIYIEHKFLDHAVLGETVIDLRSNRKISLNSRLTIKESILVLTHELVHLNQIHTNKLLLHKNGNYIWEGKQYGNIASLKTLSYYDYLQLPWEQDVAKIQQKLLENLLKN